MSIELENRFLYSENINEIWDVACKYHSKKNDNSKIGQLVNDAGELIEK